MLKLPTLIFEGLTRDDRFEFAGAGPDATIARHDFPGDENEDGLGGASVAVIQNPNIDEEGNALEVIIWTSYGSIVQSWTSPNLADVMHLQALPLYEALALYFTRCA